MILKTTLEMNKKPFIGSSFSGAPGPEHCFNTGRNTPKKGTHKCFLEILFYRFHRYPL